MGVVVLAAVSAETFLPFDNFSNLFPCNRVTREELLEEQVNRWLIPLLTTSSVPSEFSAFGLGRWASSSNLKDNRS